MKLNSQQPRTARAQNRKTAPAAKTPLLRTNLKAGFLAYGAGDVDNNYGAGDVDNV